MRKLIVLLAGLLTPYLDAQVVITPLQPVVQQGTGVLLTSNTPGAWSLHGEGTLTVIDSTHAIYTAPSHVAPNQQWGGVQILPNDHVYNMTIDHLPLVVNSAALIAMGQNAVAGGGSGDFGIAHASAGTPVQAMVFSYSPLNNGNFYFQDRTIRRQENGLDTVQMSGTDRHRITVPHDTGVIEEIYNDYPAGLNASCPFCTAQGGIRYNSLSYSLPTTGTTDAAGMLLTPAVYKKAELEAGVIKHAGRFTLAGGYIQAGTWLWPAQSTTGGGGSATWAMGSRVRLKSTFDVSSLSSPLARGLATAWQHYGMILADIGTDWNYQIEAESYSADDQAGFFEAMAKVHCTDFEVVDESSLMVSSASGLTTSPDVVVTLTTGGGSAASTAIILQGVTIGTDTTSLTVQAGTAGFQVNVWLNGSSNSNLTWTLNGPGTLSSSGIYTPPASLSSITTASITATSVADASVSLVIPVTLLPSGSILVNVGDSTDYTASDGTLWYGAFNPNHPIASWGTTPYNSGGNWNTVDITNLNSYIEGSSGDNLYYFHVPNGNYQVAFLTGESGFTSPNMRCGDFEAQGQIGYHSYDAYARIGSIGQGEFLTMPAQVTNGILTVAARKAVCLGAGYYFSGWAAAYQAFPATYAPLVGAISIKADASPRHLTIDNPQAGAPLTIGQTKKLWAVGWYMPNDVTWAVSSGPGSIDSTGLYTAPPGPVNAAVTITATSIVYGSEIATTTIPLTFGAIVIHPASPTVAHSLTDQMSATIGGVDYPKVAWSIVTGPGSINPGGLYTAPLELASDASVTIQATSLDDSTQYGRLTIAVTALLSSIRVNCGDLSRSYTDSHGMEWQSDPGMQGDPVVRYGNHSLSIAGSGGNDELYNSATYNRGTSYYLFPVPNGRYKVTLKFADYSNNPAGTYLADWYLNGVQVLSNFDLEAAAGGPLTAVDRTFTLVVNNRQIKIEGVAVSQKLMQINALEIDELRAAASVVMSGKAALSGKTM